MGILIGMSDEDVMASRSNSTDIVKRNGKKKGGGEFDIEIGKKPLTGRVE